MYQRRDVAQVGVEVVPQAEEHARDQSLDGAEKAADDEDAPSECRAPRRGYGGQHDADRGPLAEEHAGQDADGSGGKEDGDAVLDLEVDGDDVADGEEREGEGDLAEARRCGADGGVHDGWK